jgi:hypothetical protein
MADQAIGDGSGMDTGDLLKLPVIWGFTLGRGTGSLAECSSLKYPCLLPLRLAAPSILAVVV